MIIALSGYAGAGKDSVADVLVAERGFVKYAWADLLRIAAATLNPIVYVDHYNDVEYRYSDVVEQVGYTEAKAKYPEVRAILQRIGTEVGRDLIGEDVWVDATLRRINQEHPDGADIVIADTRFPNEAAAIKDLSPDNIVVRVTRPGVGPQNDHPSETSLDDYDFDSHLVNGGDLGCLRDDVLTWCDLLEISQ